ncbi:MAG: BON domain-containing protein [Vicinamibacterales bacterium]
MKTTTRATAWVGAIAIGLFAAACSDSAERRADDAADRTGAAARDAGNGAADAAREAGREAGDAMGTAGSAAGAAMETMDVKMALMASDRVDAGDINVDTNHETKTVVLKGKVPTAEQKAAAEQIAREEAEGYRVQNELMVAP